MRTIERSSAFKQDYKRTSKGIHRKTLDADLIAIIEALVADQPLPQRYRDHDLSGNWLGYRECHIKPDLLLIYRKENSDILRLTRLGAHSNLFG